MLPGFPQMVFKGGVQFLRRSRRRHLWYRFDQLLFSAVEIFELFQDLYSAEKQLVKAIPKMATTASSEELNAAFEDHLGKTRQHAQRIETIFEQMGEKAKERSARRWKG